MYPSDFPETNVIIAENQPEYIPISAHISEDGVMTCLWQLTWKERFKILFSGKLWHQVMTFKKPLQPQLLSVDKPLGSSVKILITEKGN